jgi:hypothetical protein
MWPSSILFPYTAVFFAYSLLHRKYSELLKVVGNRSSTLHLKTHDHAAFIFKYPWYSHQMSFKDPKFAMLMTLKL